MRPAASGHDQQRGGGREVRAGVDLNTVTELRARRRRGLARRRRLARRRHLAVLPAPAPAAAPARPARLRLAAADRDRRRAAASPRPARWRSSRAGGPRGRPAPRRRHSARQCCDALLGSFKVQNVATVGGNICLSLPAGPMTSLTAALDGVAAIARPDGGIRRVPVADLVTGDGANALAPGELLTHVDLPRRRAGRADRVPPGLAVGRRPVGGPRHRPPLPRPRHGSRTARRVDHRDRRHAAPGSAPLRRPAHARRRRALDGAGRGRVRRTWTTSTAAPPGGRR